MSTVNLTMETNALWYFPFLWWRFEMSCIAVTKSSPRYMTPHTPSPSLAQTFRLFTCKPISSLPYPTPHCYHLYWMSTWMFCRSSLSLCYSPLPSRLCWSPFPTYDFWFSFLLFFLVQPQIEPFNFNQQGMNGGGSLKILCTVSSGDPPFEMSWFKDNASLTSTSNFRRSQRLDDTTLMLTFSHLSLDDAGNYSCLVSSPAGNTSHSSTLQVKGT